MLGDNVYFKGPVRSASRLLQKHFREPLGEAFAGVPFWAVLGNHGYLGCPQQQVQWTYGPTGSDQPVWRMPASRFAVPDLPDWLHIYAYDSNVLAQGRLDLTTRNREPELDGIREGLCGRQGWRILIGHHPLYSAGFHAGSRSMESVHESLWPVIEECDIQLYFAGHDHDQQVIDLGNFVQVVQGAASKLRSRKLDVIPVGNERTVEPDYFQEMGFAIATFTEGNLTLEFFGEDGRPLKKSATASQPAVWSFPRQRF